MMRVAALSLAGLPLERPGDYAAALTALVERLQVGLAVLPAHTSCFVRVQGIGETRTCPLLQAFHAKSKRLNSEYLQLHSGLARRNGIYLVAGTTIEEVDGLFYHILLFRTERRDLWQAASNPSQP